MIKYTLFHILIVLTICLKAYAIPFNIEDTAGVKKKEVAKTISKDKKNFTDANRKNTPVKNSISVDKGESTTFHSKFLIDKIFVVDNKIAEIEMIDNNSFYIFGLSTGETKIYISSSDKEGSYAISVDVGYPVKNLQKIIDKTIKNHTVSVIPLKNGILIEGIVDSTEDASKLKKLAAQYIDKKDTIIDNIHIRPKAQISLQVKIAEVSRRAMNKLNIDWAGSVKSGVTSFTAALQSSVSKNFFTVTNSAFNVNAALDMLISDNKATILAEPTLMTLSGHSASFNAGGEIPYQGTSSLNNLSGNPQIQFKEYGIQLSFTPTVLGEDIHLDLKTEVSDPDDSLRLQSNGVTIPAIRKKNANTSVVLQNGQSLMIAGLLYNKRSSTSSQFPGLSKLPFVGGAFSDERNDDEERELVIVVTPYRVKPISSEKKPVTMPTCQKTVSAFEAFFLANRSTKGSTKRSKQINPTFNPGLAY